MLVRGKLVKPDIDSGGVRFHNSESVKTSQATYFIFGTVTQSKVKRNIQNFQNPNPSRTNCFHLAEQR